MKKSMCLVLCLAVLLPFFAGCGTKASDGDGFGVIHVKQTSEPIEPGNTLTAGLFKRLDSGVYHMHMVIKNDDGEPTEIHCYAKDGNAVLAMDMMGSSVRMIYKNGEAYMLMDGLKMGYVMEYDLDEDAPFLANTSNLTYVGAGSGEFEGKTYKYDEYTNEKGSRLLYYVDDGELKGIRQIDQDGTVSDTEMLAFNKEIPDYIFDIPEDYEIVDGNPVDIDPTEPTEPPPTEPPIHTLSSVFDVDIYVQYTISYGTSIGLIYHPEVHESWDNPIDAGINVSDEYLRSSIDSRLNRYKNIEGFEYFNVWVEPGRNSEYRIVIAYA